jgi:DNA adenine methylase
MLLHDAHSLTDTTSTNVDKQALHERARHPVSAAPRAFLRWAGSKRYLLPHLVDLVPEEFNRYYEPFLGSGSLFFLLQPQAATLGDACEELIACFAEVQRRPEEIISWFDDKRPDREFFYELRKHRSKTGVSAAAEFIYLNKTCWNGLYRVNSSGEFNVPYGRPKTDRLLDPELLRSCAECLQAAELLTGDFEQVVAAAGYGDLVFFDPPYVTRHNNNGFVDYNKRLFSWADQERLASCARELSGRGATVLVANALHSEVQALYESFEMKPIQRASTIASNKAFRGRVEEAVYYSRPGDRG